MNHLLVAPVVLPALLAPIIAMTMRHDLVLQRTFGLGGQVALLALAGALAVQAFTSGQIDVYELGAWPAPFGIVLVLDRLSATMLTLSALLGVMVTLYAIGSGWDRRGWHFHPLLAFQMMGVNGAFLTGDAFNLFVFFEVLLIASYGLVIHSGGALRLRAGLQYVVMNLAGSALFLFALGTLYAVLGTLNMADMAVKASRVAPEETALLAVGAVLLLLVFALKAAAFPVQFWLPATYSAAPPPVAALFAIMTKVGAYAIIRVYTLIFGEGTPELSALVSAMLLPAALVTLVVGAVGVLGSARLERAIAFSVLASMGTLLTAIALFTPAGLTAALYYMVHSTFAGAALFLVADLVRRGQEGGMHPHGITVAFYFVAAIAIAGMPPLTGFLGKVFVLQAAAPAEGAPMIWGVILGTSLALIVGFTRLGSALFWKTAPVPDGDPLDAGGGLALPGGLAATAAALPVAALALMTLASGPVAEAMDRTAAQLIDRPTYIRAVLDPAEPSAEGLRRGGGARDLGEGEHGREGSGAAPGESGAARDAEGE